MCKQCKHKAVSSATHTQFCWRLQRHTCSMSYRIIWLWMVLLVSEWVYIPFQIPSQVCLSRGYVVFLFPTYSMHLCMNMLAWKKCEIPCNSACIHTGQHWEITMSLSTPRLSSRFNSMFATIISVQPNITYLDLFMNPSTHFYIHSRFLKH